MTEYYSDKLSGPRSRTETEFSKRAWGAIVALVRRGIPAGVFAEDFPEQCADGRGVYTTDGWSLELAVLGEHSQIDWPLSEQSVPPAPAALDLIEFLHRHASAPIQRDYHEYLGHHHLTFNRKSGQAAFRDQINTILARNGLAYELDPDGRAARLLEPTLQQELRTGLPPSGDDDLDSLVAQAETKFLDPDPDVSRDALEKLWDAFERVKTVLISDKRRGADELAAAATTSLPAATLITTEMRVLTDIGNDFRIRHHETTKHPVSDELVDYLFVRMYVLLRLLFSGLEEPG